MSHRVRRYTTDREHVAECTCGRRYTIARASNSPVAEGVRKDLTRIWKEAHEK